MNRKLTLILVGAILLSALVAIVALAENRFHALSVSRNYVSGYGATLFIGLLLIATAAVISTVVLYRAKRTFAATTILLIAMLTVVAMCLPRHAQSVQNYFAHESRQSRLVEKLNSELVKDNRFKNIKLTYWYGKGEGCSIYGSVQSIEDLSELENIVKTRTELFIDSKVDIASQPHK